LFVFVLLIILGYLVYRLYQKPEVIVIREVNYGYNPYDYGNWFGGPGIYVRNWGYDSIRPTQRPIHHPHPSPHPPPHPHPRPLIPSGPHFSPHSPSTPSTRPDSPHRSM
jgi:hypothetical protein